MSPLVIGKIEEGISSIGTSSQTFISDVYYVNGLKHNLLSTCHFFYKGYSMGKS